MTDSNPRVCSDCGKPIPTDSKHQICPACLMAQAFASRTLDGSDSPNPESPPSPEEIADKFPQFEITDCLGRGGMGVVYKARQKSLNRWVAIKILAPEKLGDETFAKRFSTEAHTLARLSHPNIVTVFDHGETDGLYYIVMEFIDGVNLRDLLQDGNMEPAQALTIIPPICEALQYAHDKGIVHRDIKPENLLIDRDGRVKIADFGIASLVGATGESSGTPPYMAPEQTEHRHIDHRADIYALGAVLYEMLTGERPDSPLDLPSQKVQLDIRIDDIVLRALNKEPERRYRTANEFRTVVENVTPEKSPTPQTSRPATNSSLDPRFEKALSIVIIAIGSLNGLLTLLSLLMLPIAGRGFSRGFERGFGRGLSHPPSQLPMMETLSGPITSIIVLSTLFTLAVSTLCILGGRHMYRSSSRAWAFTGAIACCLTPLFWPLGMILGVSAFILLLLDNDQASPREGDSPAAENKAQLSVMAVVAATLVILPFVLILCLALAKMVSQRPPLLPTEPPPTSRIEPTDLPVSNSALSLANPNPLKS